MRVLLSLASIVSLLVGAAGFLTYRSDIQLIIGFVGIFSAVIMAGQVSILNRLRDLYD